MARVFSGIQPSGELHIGNYLGAVQNWVRLQHEHECLFSVVDLHAVTQAYDPAGLPQRTLDMAGSLFAAGLDPERAIVFVQSHVPEHAELNWLLMSVAPLGELERPGDCRADECRLWRGVRGSGRVVRHADQLRQRRDRGQH
jgi:tryptophanyl-tRNA synthetase